MSLGENGDQLSGRPVCTHRTTVHVDDERRPRGVARGVGQILPRVQFNTADSLSVAGDAVVFCGQRPQEARSESVSVALCITVRLVITPFERSRERRKGGGEVRLLPSCNASPSHLAV